MKSLQRVYLGWLIYGNPALIPRGWHLNHIFFSYIIRNKMILFWQVWSFGGLSRFPRWAQSTAHGTDRIYSVSLKSAAAASAGCPKENKALAGFPAAVSQSTYWFGRREQLEISLAVVVKALPLGLNWEQYHRSPLPLGGDICKCLSPSFCIDVASAPDSLEASLCLQPSRSPSTTWGDGEGNICWLW